MKYNIETDESGSILYVHNEKENHHIMLPHITYVKVLETCVQLSLTSRETITFHGSKTDSAALGLKVIKSITDYVINKI